MARPKMIDLKYIRGIPNSGGGGGGGGAVDSVNGKTGVVVLTPADISAATSAQGVKADTAVQSITGTGVDNTDPRNPVISGGGGGNTITAVKSADEGRASTNVRARDADLTINLPQAGCYYIRSHITAKCSSTTPKISMQFVAEDVTPTYYTYIIQENGGAFSGVGQLYQIFNSGTGIQLPVNSPGSAGTLQIYQYDFCLTVPAATRLTLFWSQAVSNAASTILIGGSYMSASWHP